MSGGNPPKPPPASAHAHRRNFGRDPSAASKSKPSPTPTAAAPPNNKLHNPPITKRKPSPENPSPGPEHPNVIPGPRPIFPSNDRPPPPPSYGFHMLERRSIVLPDGSVRSYLALPQDYESITTHMPRPALRPELMARNEFRLERPPLSMSPGFLGPDGRAPNPGFWNPGPENSLKRKIREDERGGRDDGFERQRQQLLQYGNVNGPGPILGYNVGIGEEMTAHKNTRFVEGSSRKVKHSEVDQSMLNKSFLHFVKLLFENPNQRKKFLADGKQGPVACLSCRSSKVFPNTHSLIMHAYTPDHPETTVDHLGFHKALCVLMGWNYTTPPDNTKSYQYFSPDRAEAIRDDLIMWPPSVLIHNTITGKDGEGRMEGLGNKAIDSVLRGLGFTSGKAMSMHTREGHVGIHMVKFSADEPGLKEALRLSDYFERENRGRKGWARVQPSSFGNKDDEHNPSLVRLNPKTGEKERVLYGHLATIVDLDKVTFEFKKRASIVSASEFKNP